MKTNTQSLNPADMQDVEILARTLYGEARGENISGKEAVANVILNRVAKARTRGGRYWWGASVRDVCLKKWQFSCWNTDDPNREKLLRVTSNNRTYQSCLRIARRAIAGTLKDPTSGATHYHTNCVFPPWARGRMYACEIGNHQFYNDVE